MNTGTMDTAAAAESPRAVVAVIVAWFAVIVTWAIVGLMAFVWSLVCFARSGTALDKVVGLLLSIFFGPLFFLYLAVNSTYCRR